MTPVLVDGVCVAALHVADVEPDRFDETEASLLRAVAEQVAAALRGARLRAESEQRAGRLAVTLQVATAVAGERTVDSTLRAAVRAIAASIEAHAFSAFIPLPETGEQECVIDVDPTGGVEAERRPLEGITTGAVLTGAGQVNIGDARTHDGYRPWREDSAYRSVLLTPVVVDDQVAAAIGLYSLEPHRFNADDAVLMRTLAEQVAAALRGARLRDESERRARRLAVTLDVARAVADAPAIEDALRSAVETVADAIHCGSVAGFMALPETAEQLCVIDIDRHGASVQGMRQPQFAGHNGIVFRTGRQLHLRKQDDAPPGLRWTADDWEYQSAVFTPVQLAGHTVAVITLTDTAVGRFDDDDALLMRTVAEQLAAALRGASLRDESERRARRLALTLEVAKAVATAATPVETLRSAVEAIDTHIDCGAVAAFLAERETEEQVSIVDIDRHGNSTEGMRRSMDEGTTGRVFETGRQLVLGNSAGRRRVRPLAGERIGVRVGADHAGRRGRALRRRARPVRHRRRPLRRRGRAADGDGGRAGRSGAARRAAARSVREPRAPAGGAGAPPARAAGAPRARPGAGAHAGRGRPARRHGAGALGVRDRARSGAPRHRGG